MNFVEKMRWTVNANKEAYPTLSQWTDAMWESPFMKELVQDQHNLEQGRRILELNGKPIGQALWNLMVSKRDFSLWTKHKIKPNRDWKVNTTKKYYGIKGTGENLMNQFMLIHDVVYSGNF
tara:strand:- start:241 stop:603 length:363 start_codon:yes stop_codon:yes gene_type:complete